jgi:hypothetical protein
VIAALVLWLIAAAAGAILGRALEGGTSGPPPRVLYAVATVAVAALLVDMIFKPGT